LDGKQKRPDSDLCSRMGAPMKNNEDNTHLFQKGKKNLAI